MAANFSDVTPAAPSGHVNVAFQSDASGNISANIPTPVDAGTQAANKVLAGPTTGSAATPAFRLLVAADIPNIAESQVTSLTTDLAAKAPLASPTFTGTPAAPTATGGTNTTQIATTAFVQTALAGVGSGSVTLPLSFGWMMSTVATGANVGKRLVAPRAGQITGGRVVVDAADASIDLTFDIKKNGTSIFSSAPTITHGASGGSVTDLTSALSSNPTAITAADVFTLDITSGSSSWQFTVVMG